MGDPHFRIVHNRGQRIQKLAIGPDQHRIRHGGGIDRNVAEDAVGPGDPRMIQLEPPDAIAPLCPQGGFLFFREGKRGTVIHRGLAHVQQLLALEVQLGRGFPCLVEAGFRAQLIRRCHVAIEPRRLRLDPIPCQAQPFQIFLNAIRVFLLGPLRIRVVEAQNELPARFPGDQPVEQRRAQVADMEIAGGRGGKTGDSHREAPLRCRGAAGRIFPAVPFHTRADLSISEPCKIGLTALLPAAKTSHSLPKPHAPLCRARLLWPPRAWSSGWLIWLMTIRCANSICKARLS